ncbi:RING/Ubox like zinc-binding domain-containing protein [Dipodascopsis tothii]|uniref:RING/Ubox like zinc-binding domain-containing protein n=1 Tax=Dipodascopsis tothii TaxID=44089 RepID=UPI0034CFC8E8
MSRLAQDSFISDDEEELCPLCVEEFDISDKGFKPCPCGYQVCQFCYNNIRQNPQLNGRCPGCRRPYDDESVEYKIVTPEEWRQDHQKQTRREKEKKQKERERKEIEQASRKHLSGMRVIQKNLVYVIGLNPHIPHDELHNTLRGEQFFGQYGKIQKIVVNRRNGVSGNSGIGVYVTYYKKEDAAKCIAAVDGSINDGKMLRAAYGTTKYCSSYLRNQPCPNPNCMFLHEPGEEADSYTRQDLSTIQHAARQNEMKPSGLSRSNTGHRAAKAAPPPPAAVPPAVAEEPPAEPEGSALPPTASWAAKASPTIQNSKLSRASTASPIRPSSTAGLAERAAATPSPSQENAPPPARDDAQTQTQRFFASVIANSRVERAPAANPTVALFENTFRLLSQASSLRFAFSTQVFSPDEMHDVQSMPSLFAFSATLDDGAVAAAK